MKEFKLLFKLKITLIIFLYAFIAKSQIVNKSNADTFMNYLPEHTSHLDTYTWDKVQRGVIVRYRNNPSFSSEAIRIIAENCIFIQLHEGVTQSTREDFTIAYPNRIYRFAYKNLVIHYEGLDDVFKEVPEWFMHLEGGSPNIWVDGARHPKYNLRNTTTLYHGKNLHEWWIDQMREQISATPPGNTIFIDALAGAMRIGQGTADGGLAKYDYWGNDISENPYHNSSYTEDYLRPFLASIRDEFADEMILTGNFLKPWFLPDGNYSYVRDYAHCSYIENFERNGSAYTKHLNTGIDNYRRSSQDGKMTYFNLQMDKPTPATELTIEQMRTKASYSMPEFYSSLEDQTEKDALAEMYAYFEFKLALFLLGANEYSYFGYSSTVIGDDAGDSLFRTIPPFPEFKYPLGKPLGSAVRDGDIWTRDFEHVSVRLDAKNGTATINWGTASISKTLLKSNNSKLKIIPNVIQDDTREVIIEGIPIDQKDIELLNLNGQVICHQFSYVNTYTSKERKRYNRWRLSNLCDLNKGVYILRAGRLRGQLIVY